MDKVIQDRKKSFWGDERFHDISFSFEDSEEILKANRMILSLVSPVFEAMFYGDFAKQDPVPIKDIGYDTFKDFLYFIYTENFTLTTLEEAEQLFYVANKYEVVSIEAACERFIIKNIKNYDTEEVLRFAEMFNLKNLEWLSRLLKDHAPDPALPANWVPYKRGQPYPSHMVFVANDEDGFPIGIGRFKVEHDLLPGTFYTRERFVQVGYACTSHKNSEEFEVLCDGDLDWRETEKGDVDSQAVEGGKASGYEPLFIGKIVHEGKVVIGKIHRSHACLYIPWQAAEMKVSGKYFHLIDKNTPKRTERQLMPYYHRHASFDSDEENLRDGNNEAPLPPLALP